MASKFQANEESPSDYNNGGYLPIHVTDSFSSARYRVVRKLGWGHFSTVWLVKDAHLNRHSALKVVKSAGRYAETARDEIKLLAQVSAAAPSHPGREFIVSFMDSFTHHGPESSHICIVFEPLGENLLALIERNKKTGVAPALVKVIARQVLLGLQYLHDECDLVHTDIKPENILISIPDVETHISTELAHSPSPTSHKVGVPLPAKSRAGVTIPQSHQRPRRQVQIFESQPLSSPSSRSAGLATSNSFGQLAQNTSGAGHGSTPSSLGGSYVPPSQLGKFASTSNNLSSMSSDQSSSVSKPLSGLSMTAPKLNSNKEKIADLNKQSTQHPQNTASPASTSSSSSSLSSTMTSSQTLSSSSISTPPTSLGHSLGSAVVGLMKMSLANGGQSPLSVMSSNPVSVPSKNKGKGKIAESELEEPCPPSSSWRDVLSSPSSWKDRLSRQLVSSSPKDVSPNLMRHSLSGHSRSASGISVSSSWKDPGASAPAPAVVVSATARPESFDGGKPGEYFGMMSASLASSTSELTSHSQSSSGTVTETRPSPLETPTAHTEPCPCHPAQSSHHSGISASPLEKRSAPSLLSQTAPSQMVPQTPATERPVAARHSPPHHISHLSAHMHIHPPPDYSTPRVEARDVLASLAVSSFPSDTLTNPIAASSLGIETMGTSPSLTSSTPLDSGIISLASPPSDQGPTKPNLPLLDAPSRPPVPPISIKIADLGNATPSRKHFTEDIQTRQYRAPEAILGRKDWDTRADVWSVACLIFELLTAEYLFDPQGQSDLFTKDDDHMAQIIELLGDFPLEVKMGGKYSRELFDHNGSLRYIKTLKPWPLKDVMTQKYSWPNPDAQSLCHFLVPMLATDMRQRSYARDMVDHPWLTVDPDTCPQQW